MQVLTEFSSLTKLYNPQSHYRDPPIQKTHIVILCPLPLSEFLNCYAAGRVAV